MKTLVDFHVMPAGLGAFPMILGRPWLQSICAIQDWRCDTINVYGKTSRNRTFDMRGKVSLDEEFEDGEDSSDKESSIESEVGNGSTSNSDEDFDMALLVVDKEFEETSVVAFVDEGDDDYDDMYGVIEEGVESEMEPDKRQELMTMMPSIYSASKVKAVDKRTFLEGVVTMVLTIFEWLIAWWMIHAICC